MSSSGTYFLEVGARVSLKAVTKVFLEAKKLLKLRLLDYFSEAKMEECDQKDWSILDKSGIMPPSSATDYLEVGAPVSLIALTKASLRGKKVLKT